MRRPPYGVSPRLRTSTSRAIVNRNSVLISGMEALPGELIGNPLLAPEYLVAPSTILDYRSRTNSREADTLAPAPESVSAGRGPAATNVESLGLVLLEQRRMVSHVPN